MVQEKTNSKKAKLKEQESTSLFKNSLLEKLTHTHAAVPIAMYVIIGMVSLIYGVAAGRISFLTSLWAFPLGFLLFTLVEYCVHRFVFHMEPTTKLKKELAYKFHGVHHDYPKDKSRLAMPPVISIVLASIVVYVYYLIMGNIAFPFAGGFLAGYGIYLWVHYIVHAQRPPKNFLKVLWVHHGIHHYKTEDKAFGVSSPLWDYIFGTMPR